MWNLICYNIGFKSRAIDVQLSEISIGISARSIEMDHHMAFLVQKELNSDLRRTLPYYIFVYNAYKYLQPRVNFAGLIIQ